MLDKSVKSDLRFDMSMGRYSIIECNKAVKEAISSLDIVHHTMLPHRFFDGFFAFSGLNRFVPAKIKNDELVKFRSVRLPDNGNSTTINGQWEGGKVRINLTHLNEWMIKPCNEYL